MSKRCNKVTGRKEPKPSASARTWTNWRIRKEVANSEDDQRKKVRDDVRADKLQMKHRVGMLNAMKNKFPKQIPVSDHVSVET